ncbi:MAG: ATP-binding cassette domain-containing protein, partial [Anaerolineales bacterium]|nr:ATP-binding cassette domain-containing protein [Anaerolineales bacterium]
MMILEIKNVVAGYLPDVNVLQGINIHVSQGELVCMIGPNGAGKSTVLRAISGILKPSQGEILFGGKNIGGLRPDLVLRQGIAHVPQGHSSFPEMTVKENLLMGAYVLNNRTERERRMGKIYEMFPFLKERKNEKA